ncbi:MAG: hypothetical protein JWM68_958 [Verrucomicrobiales bacterium]|nr:hypothetical protein [Verrucomicrobiales bacterium]
MKTKNKILRCIVLTLAWAFLTHVAQGQTTNQLKVSAEARLLVEANDTRVFLSIHVLNSSDREVTILTKNLNVETDGSTSVMTFVVGYAGQPVTRDGHIIVPSLYDFSPVTLKPNEEALVTKEMNHLQEVTPATKFVVQYVISHEWAKRFGLWSGSVESKPFTAQIKKPQ